jgi:hypothetical protein
LPACAHSSLPQPTALTTDRTHARAGAAGIEGRLQQLEVAADEQRQALAAVRVQQEELWGLVMRLMGLLEAGGGGGAANSSSTNSQAQQVQGLGEEVGRVSVGVCSLQGQCNGLQGAHASLEERLGQLGAASEDRHARVETAIYQVARQVDVLDTRMREEQGAALKALQAVLLSSSAGGSSSGVAKA